MMGKEGTEGFTPESSGVPVEGAQGGVPQEGMPSQVSGDAREEGSGEGTPERSPEGKTVPEAHLRELQSVKDRELADARRGWENEKFQMIQALMASQDEVDKARYVGDEAGYSQARAGRQQVMSQYADSQRQGQFEAMARTIAVKQMAMTYGVKEEDLAGFHHPEDMERFAKGMSQRRRTETFERRRDTNADAAEGSASSGSNPIKGLMDVDKLLALGYGKKR